MRGLLISLVTVFISVSCNTESLLEEGNASVNDISFTYPTEFAFRSISDYHPIAVWSLEGKKPDATASVSSNSFIKDFDNTIENQLSPQLTGFNIRLVNAKTLMLFSGIQPLDTFTYRIFQNEIYVDNWTQFTYEDRILKNQAFAYVSVDAETRDISNGFRYRFYEDFSAEVRTLLSQGDTMAIRDFTMEFGEE